MSIFINGKEIKPFHLHTSHFFQNPRNTEYPDEILITGTFEGITGAFGRDHVAPKLKGNHRNDENFLWADCLPNDCDNSHSEDEADWRTPDDFADTFPDVQFLYCYSRHHMISKRNGDRVYAPRPKWHAYLPTSRQLGADDYVRYQKTTYCLFPYLDTTFCTHKSQFIFGVEKPDVGIEEGTVCIDQYIDSLPEAVLKQMMHDSMRDFLENFIDITDSQQFNSTLQDLCRFAGYYPEGLLPAAGDAERQKSVGFEYDSDWFEWQVGNVRKILTDCDISIIKEQLNKSQHKHFFYIPCAWSEQHTSDDDTAKIIIYGNGAIVYKCHHAHCAGRTWTDFKAKIGYVKPPAVTGELTQIDGIEDAPDLLQKLDTIQTRDGTKLKVTAVNYALLLRHVPKYKGLLRYNLFSGQMEVDRTRAWWNSPDPSFTDFDNAQILLDISQTYGIESDSKMQPALTTVAHKHEYHPVRDILDNLKWDGVPRIHRLFPKYLGAEECEYTTAVTKLTLFGAIHRIYQAGCKFDTMTCLIGAKQGGGKSTLVRYLALKDEWFTDNVGNLNDRKECGENIAGKWIIEFGEMVATSSAKNVETIKAFISSQNDRRRDAYGRYSKDYYRQCIFIGTTNNAEFLPEDKTGNRRFIPLRVFAEKAEVHPCVNPAECRQFVIQCYAEAMESYRQGEYFLIMPENQMGTLLQMQEDATPQDSRVGLIQDWLDRHPDVSMVCTRLLWEVVLQNEKDMPKYESRALGEIMNTSITGWSRTRTNRVIEYDGTHYGKQRAWERTPAEDFESVGDGDAVPFGDR